MTIRQQIKHDIRLGFKIGFCIGAAFLIALVATATTGCNSLPKKPTDSTSHTLTAEDEPFIWQTTIYSYLNEFPGDFDEQTFLNSNQLAGYIAFCESVKLPSEPGVGRMLDVLRGKIHAGE